MKKGLVILFITLAAISLAACNTAKKPVPPQNNTKIVPEVRTVNFEKINPKTAPKIIQDIANALQNRDATSWANEGNHSYLIINRGESTKNYQLKVEQVLQRMPETDYTWLDVKLLYNKNTKNDPAEESLTIIKAYVSSLPKGAAFTISGLPFSEQSSQKPASPPVKQPDPSGSQTVNGAVIEQPSPNQQITNPVQVQGKITTPGQQIRVRISTRTGQIIKEESIASIPGTGTFNKKIQYNPPDLAIPGEIEIISTFNGDDKILAGVPVIIK